MTGLLEIDGLSVAFGGVKALTDVSMTVTTGTVHGLIGPNGAGKTTLLNAISRLVPPDRGAIRFDGQDLLAAQPDQIAGFGISRTFQNFGLIPEFSVRDNVTCGYHCRHKAHIVDEFLMPWRRNAFEREASAQVGRVLHATGLDIVADQPVSGLSYGLRKAVELARGMVAAPRLLLLDEPTAGLTSPDMIRLRETLDQFRRDSDLTIVVITHHLEFLTEIADTVTVLDLGRVIASGTPAEVQKDRNVIRAYIGEEV